MEDEVPKLVLEVEASPEAKLAAPYATLARTNGGDVAVAMTTNASSLSGDRITMLPATQKADDMKVLSVDTNVKPIVCHLCEFDRRFEREYSLVCHLKWVHGQDLADNDAVNDLEMEQELIQIGDAQVQSPGAGNLQCPLCPASQRRFDRPFSLQCHLRAVHGIRHSEFTNKGAPIISVKNRPDSAPRGSNQSLQKVPALCPSTVGSSPRNSGPNVAQNSNTNNAYQQVLDDKTGQIVIVPASQHSTVTSSPDTRTDTSNVTSKNLAKSTTTPSGMERPHRRARSVQRDEETNSVNNLPNDSDTQSKPDGSNAYSRLRPQRTASEPNTNNSSDASKNGTMSLRKRKPDKPADDSEEDVTPKVTRRSVEVKAKVDTKSKVDTKGKVENKKVDTPVAKRPARNLPTKASQPSRPSTRTRKR